MASQLYAGVARSDITPKLGTHVLGYFNDRLAEDIHDPIYSKALVVQNDDTALAIVVLDLGVVYGEDMAVIKQRASELSGIPAENMLITCTHTHSGPATIPALGTPRDDDYTEWALEKAADAVKLAQNRLEPVRIGHASGSCPEETHNRRWHMQDGSVIMHPPYQSPDIVRPAGPKDAEVAVAVFLGEDDRTVSVLCNYAVHYVAYPAAQTVSANFFGALCANLERMGGGDFVAVAANGCCGDLYVADPLQPAPENPYPYYQVQRAGNAVAASAYGAWQQIREFAGEVELGGVTRMVDFRRREVSAEEMERARQLYEGNREEDYFKDGQVNMPEYKEWIYARELLLLAEEPMVRQTPVMGMRIGDLGIAAMPGEMFADYGLQIKARSPFARTMTIELANDYIGYCPTDIALEEGSYETRLARTSKAAPGTEGQMIAAAVGVLDELAK
jgi:neutral ceramidase